METEAGGEAKARKVVFHRVAENLYRLETSGGYYALLKRGDKQFRRSLKTKDRKLAERRLTDLRTQVGSLTVGEDARLGFDEVADRWKAATQHGLKPSSVLRRETCIRNLSPFFSGISVRNVQSQHCERWVTERGAKLAPQTFVHELDTMRLVFDYSVKIGLMLANPAKDIKRPRIISKSVVVPTREQFKKLVATIRASDGRLDSQRKAKAGADLVELLAYSGCRIQEATSLHWSDVNFERNSLTVSGGEIGTKNGESRTIPMTAALRELLRRLRGESTLAPSARIAAIHDAKKCLRTASRRLCYPRFTHHDFRHFYATTCIEAGVDIPTVSRWLGHKDGGALAMRVYGHLRQEHSFSMVKRVQF
ncbi:MAG TPA: tyrosine-type recombinase/integrase [Bryobacteraceae bacterium]|nr:tyrosine-type recombinase/integrase [Bryobacteraceae bacterium]